MEASCLSEDSFALLIGHTCGPDVPEGMYSLTEEVYSKIGAKARSRILFWLAPNRRGWA